VEVETGTRGHGWRGDRGRERESPDRAREEQRDSDGRVRGNATGGASPSPTRAAPSVLAARAPHGVLRSEDERAGGAAAVSATPATGFSARFVGSFCSVTLAGAASACAVRTAVTHGPRADACQKSDARQATSPPSAQHCRFSFSLPRAELVQATVGVQASVHKV
jgi:hypothetical protein